jgi:Helix-turn-helix domain
MSESTLPKKATQQFKTCLFEVCKLPIENFRLPTDGRKWKAAASARKTLLVQLAGFADADGTSIRPSTQTLADQTGFSRSKVCRLLDDLKELGFMERTGRYGQRGAAIRRLMLPENASGTESKTPPLGVQDSIVRVSDSILRVSDRILGVSDSISQSVTAMTQDLPLQTCLTDPPSKPVRKTDELRDGMVKTFSKARPDENLNWAGFADIETLAEEFGNESVCKVWKRWLKNRDTHGMKFHFQWFRKEFDTVRADLQLVEHQQKAFEKMRDAAYAADDAKTQRENEAIKLKWAAEETERARLAKACRESGLPY